MSKTGNYREAKENGAGYFLKMLGDGTVKMSPGNDGIFRLRILDADYEISSSDGSVRDVNDGTEAGFSESLLCYDIIMNDDGNIRPSGEMVLLNRLSSIHNARSFAGEGMFGKYEEIFSGKIPELKQGCEKLGGTVFGKADVSYILPFYKDMKMVFEFWERDEDFPPQINCLFDRNILSYMHYEACWYLAFMAVKSIGKASGLEMNVKR